MEELNENIKKLIEAIGILTESIDQLYFKQKDLLDTHAPLSDQLSTLTNKLQKLIDKD
jgi:hypothetical protein